MKKTINVLLCNEVAHFEQIDTQSSRLSTRKKEL